MEEKKRRAEVKRREEKRREEKRREEKRRNKTRREQNRTERNGLKAVVVTINHDFADVLADWDKKCKQTV